MFNIAGLISLIFQIAYILMIARIIFSFVRVKPQQNKTLYSIKQIVWKLTEPILAPLRKYIPPITVGGGSYIDISPLVALLILSLLRNIVYMFA